MAVFERKEDRMISDDSKTYILEIKETQNVNGHIEYKIEVCRYPDIEDKWVVSHRFSDFVSLHAALKTPTINLPSLPPKKVFGNTEKDFLNERKPALQNYLDKLLESYFVSISPQFRKFVDPKNYGENFTEDALQNLVLSLRSSGSHEVTQTMPHIGTRVRKKYFLGRPLSDPKAQHLLWWSPYGPDRVKNLRDVHVLLTALLHCQHPYIVSAVSCIATESGVCIVRPWFPQGSLRDYIYGVHPQFDSLLKYSNNKRRQIPLDTCAVYGKQILEALAFLHEKGFAHGSVHTGNVVIENNVCQLIDLENQVLGLPHHLRRLITKIKRVTSPQTADVYCFGHLLYEMVFRDPLLTETCHQFPEESSPLCRSVLEGILSEEACRSGLPSPSGLLTHPFFTATPLRSDPRPFLKTNAAARQALAAAYDAAFHRLREDQRKVKFERQKCRAEAAFSGEEVPSSKWSKKSASKNVRINEDQNSEKDLDSSANNGPVSDSDGSS